MFDRARHARHVVGRRVTRSQAGTVTAETAIALPLMAAFVMVLVWLLSAVTAQIRVVDAARDAARAVARGDDTAQAVAAATATAPEGASVDVSQGSALATVTVRVDAEAPGWLLVPLPSVPLESTASVGMEEVDDE